MIIKAHTSIIGDTGYNTHSRNFFQALNKLVQVQVRNWTVGNSWRGLNDEPHNNEYYMNDVLKQILVQQTLTTPNGLEEFNIYPNHPNIGNPDVHIVLNDNLHPYFAQSYDGLKIAYNVWETTRQPEDFFNHLKKFDQVWVPSEWQKQCTIEQGIPEHKVKVVPEGVDGKLFYPTEQSTNDVFTFLVVGRWEYRKSTQEIIRAFTQTFSEDENVQLLLLVDNPFATDGLNSTKERLEKYGIKHSGIKVIHNVSKEEYVKLMQSANVFVSCSRGEGWNLPLIEAMACGIPSIYSDYGAQLQFASDKGIPVNIKGEIDAGIPNLESWDCNAPGKFADPDFDHLKEVLRDSYANYRKYKIKALSDSSIIRSQFTWDNAAKQAYQYLQELKLFKEDFMWVTCGNAQYMPIIGKLATSLKEFSNSKLLVYLIGDELPSIDLPNVIIKKLKVPEHSIHDKWYWKQYACIKAIEDGLANNYIWVDGDIIANHNIDNLSQYFPKLTNYPISDIHKQEEFVGYFREEGTTYSQLFNENLCNKFNVVKHPTKAHICMYLFNAECKWFFEEILSIYKSTPLEEYNRMLQWNDEGIDNFLRSKYNFTEYLPLSNFDVSGWDGDSLMALDAIQDFIKFWNKEGPYNFGKIYGWQYIPKDKSQILYFHGNKNLEFADLMIDYIKTQRDTNFADTEYFFVPGNIIQNLGKIKGVEGSTLDVASKYGWTYAIYHEVYNLKDYGRYGTGVMQGDVVVDLGGNIGIFSRYAYQQGASKIITFEPDRRYFEVLRQNVSNNTILFNAAIGSSLSKIRLTEADHLGGSNVWHRIDPTKNQYDVNVYTLDYILSSGIIPKIDFLKIDIEGSEIEALKGISDDNLRNIRNVVIEYHHAHLQYDEQLRQSVIDRFTHLNFNSFVLFCGNNSDLQLIYLTNANIR